MARMSPRSPRRGRSAAVADALATLASPQSPADRAGPAAAADGAAAAAAEAAEHAAAMRAMAAGQASAHADALRADIERLRSGLAGAAAAMRSPTEAAQAWTEYLVDASQRWWLAMDIMRRRGNQFLEHEAQGQPPVLDYEWEMVVDGRTLPRPANYAVVRIVPPAGVTVDPAKRPFIVVDPRAGHGPGIGGFKDDSQVGVALRAGHPVYFVIFFPHPEPGQTLADVTAAEAEFVREVARRHPDAPRAAVLGNCQGGWATMILAATHPEIMGPVVMSGAPLSYWAGERGENPMRYLGGFSGGTLSTLLMADLGAGRFDGANLVQNFESLNPARTWFRKYFDVFARADTEADRFLEFERWWSGFYFMNEAEIRWIVENLFVGNRLARGEARLEPGRPPIDFKQIKTPIVVFASHGDNITPVQQALNWIADCYADVDDIRIHGQRIIYTIHDEVGHLGIFVSGAVARREHDRIVNVLQMIESLPPGLYEMTIEDVEEADGRKRYSVSFHERTIADVLSHDDGRDDEEAFAGLAELSELWTKLYEMGPRPLVRAMAAPSAADVASRMHPMRLGYAAFSDLNPAGAVVESAAAAAAAQRRRADPANPFLSLEKLWATAVENWLDRSRDMRAGMLELGFTALYGNPWVRALGRARHAEPHSQTALPRRERPEVKAVLAEVGSGGYAEAAIRMLILLARARGSVRRSRLERSNAILRSVEPFASLGDETRARMINAQSLIVEFEPEQAIATLPDLLPDPAERLRAAELCEEVAGPLSEMEPKSIAMLDRLRAVLDLPPTGASAPRGAAAE